MALTYIALASVTVGSGGAADIQFTNIPQTYTDLLVRCSLRTNTAGAEAIIIQFNGSTSDYSARRLFGEGVGAVSDTLTNIRFAIDTASDTASTFCNGDFYIPNYTSNAFKSVSVDGVSENNATAAVASLVAGLWSDTSAINSIKLVGNAGTPGTIVQHSTATLYGIKNTV